MNLKACLVCLFQVIKSNCLDNVITQMVDIKKSSQFLKNIVPKNNGQYLL